MLAIAATIILAQTWRRCLIAFCAGAAGALALAPFNVFPALFIPMVAAVWLIDGAGHVLPKPLEAGGKSQRRTLWMGFMPPALRRSFSAGFWWGVGYFLAGLWWLGAAFLVDAEEFAWALPLGVIGLPAFLALFPAFGFLLARCLWSPGVFRIFALAAALSFTEWVRGHVLTGFPWNTFGMALGGNLVLAQLASLAGLYGLTLAATLIFAAPAAAISWNSAAPRPQWARWPLLPPAAALLTLAAILGFGALRLTEGDPGAVAGVALRIMQPNLPQDEKFRPENKDAILAYYLELSKGEGKNGARLKDVTALIWPESAFPFILSRDPLARFEIGAALSPGAVLITGAARQGEDFSTDAREDSAFDPQARATYYNAIQVVDARGKIRDSYDKVHLVPFGEYLPLRFLLEPMGLHHFIHVPGGFEAGAKRHLLNAPDLLNAPSLPPIAPLVCYEAIFPGEVLPPQGEGPRPGWLLNVTNDGWFGMTPGPYQHFAQARLRAIEEGLPLARAASTGLSAIIDPHGRVLAELPLGVAGILDTHLPQPLAPPLFARFPHLVFFLSWCVVLAFGAAARFGFADRHSLRKIYK
jgi:apolipoprotein N-acyltransferase